MSLKLSNTTKRSIMESATVRGMIADLFGKSIESVRRWVEEDNPLLTVYDAILIYQERFSLSIEQIFEDQKEAVDA